MLIALKRKSHELLIFPSHFFPRRRRFFFAGVEYVYHLMSFEEYVCISIADTKRQRAEKLWSYLKSSNAVLKHIFLFHSILLLRSTSLDFCRSKYVHTDMPLSLRLMEYWQILIRNSVAGIHDVQKVNMVHFWPILFLSVAPPQHFLSCSNTVHNVNAIRFNFEICPFALQRERGSLSVGIFITTISKLICWHCIHVYLWVSVCVCKAHACYSIKQSFQLIAEKRRKR